MRNAVIIFIVIYGGGLLFFSIYLAKTVIFSKIKQKKEKNKKN